MKIGFAVASLLLNLGETFASLNSSGNLDLPHDLVWVYMREFEFFSTFIYCLDSFDTWMVFVFYCSHYHFIYGHIFIYFCKGWIKGWIVRTGIDFIMVFGYFISDMYGKTSGVHEYRADAFLRTLRKGRWDS